MRDPDTKVDTLVSSNSYRYGTSVTVIAPTAPNQSTFSTWLGDTNALIPNALASSASIENLTANTTLIATYFYPETPDYYALTVYDGTPNNQSYPAGSQVEIKANDPSPDWEFYKWIGDTSFIVNPEDIYHSTALVAMPQQSIVLRAKYKIIGEQPLFRVNVTNGTANAEYQDYYGERTRSVRSLHRCTTKYHSNIDS